MTLHLSRRRWLLSLAVATSSLALRSSATAQAPQSSPRIAALEGLPVTSRVLRLQGDRSGPVVVTAIAADPRGEWLAAAGDDHVIRILSVSNLQTIHQIRAHRDIIRTLAFDPAGDKLVSAGNDGQLMVWDRNEAFANLQKMQGTPALARVCFAPDGSEMAAVGFDSEVYLMGRRTQGRPRMRCDCDDLRAVAYREDSQMIAVAGRSGDLHLFDLTSGELTGEHALHRGRIQDVVFHRQSNTAICVAEDGAVSIFDTAGQRLIHRVEVTTGKLFAVAVINSQMVAVAGSDNVIRIVDTDEGRVVETLEGHRGSISTLTATADMLFSGSFDATLRRWSIADLLGQGNQRIAELPTATNP